MNDGGYMAVSPLNSNYLCATGNVSDSTSTLCVAVSHSSDGGTTWEHDTIRLGSRGWAIAFDGLDENRIYVGGDSAYNYSCLLISTDLGETWTMSCAGLSGTVNALMTVPGNGQLIYAGTTNGLFVSTDAGATWEVTGVPGSVRAVACDPARPSCLFAGTYEYGVYASTDGGINWSEMNAGLTCNKVLSLALRPGTENTIYAGTEGGSVFKTTVMSGVSGGMPVAHRPSPIAISPNPCRGFATVRVNPSLLSAHSSISVYDAAGRLARTFAVRASSLASQEPVGQYALRTSGLRPGAYFVRLTSGSETHISRLTVLN